MKYMDSLLDTLVPNVKPAAQQDPSMPSVGCSCTGQRPYDECVFPEIFKLTSGARPPVTPKTKEGLCCDYLDVRDVMSMIQAMAINVNQGDVLAGNGLGNLAAFTTNTTITLDPSSGLPFATCLVGFQIKGNENISQAVGELEAQFYEWNAPQQPHVQAGTAIAALARTGTTRWKIDFAAKTWQEQVHPDFPFHAFGFFTTTKETGRKELAVAKNSISEAHTADGLVTGAGANVRSTSPVAAQVDANFACRFILSGLPTNAALDVKLIYPGTEEWRLAKIIIDGEARRLGLR